MEVSYENNTVLFVDDEVNILKSLKRGLMREPYEKLFANSGAEALEILKDHDIHVIVTDMRMPGMSGLELLKEVKIEYPDMVKIVLSGYTQLPQVLATVNQGDIFKFITKPWDLENEFKQVIRDAIDFYNIKYENELLKTSLSKKNEVYQKLLRSNDEKLRFIKRDFKEIFEMQADMNQFVTELCDQKINGKIKNDQFDEVKAQMESLLTQLSDLFPSEYSEIQLNRLMEDTNRIVFEIRHLGKKYDRKVAGQEVGFFGLDSIKGSFRGNYKLLHLVIKTIFENILKCKIGNIYNVVVKQGEIKSEHGHSQSKLVFLIDETVPTHEKEDAVVKMNLLILDRLLKSMGGGFQITHKNNKLIVILEVELLTELT